MGAEQPGGRVPGTVPGGLQQACLEDRPGPCEAGELGFNKLQGLSSFQGPAPSTVG